MTGTVWLLAFFSIALSAAAQLLMKIGMSGIGSPALTGSPSLIASISNPYVAGGFAAYGIGAILWLQVLSRMDLSMAYPLVSIGFVLVAGLSWLVLGEPLSFGRVVGTVLIIAGVVFMGTLSS